jgi:alpha-amylase/alpha-mannosidase (GH57 family)
MSTINLCFLWHMHQPLYKDLVSGEYRLPWARLHALKDYYGMVNILEDFPDIHQTFNLVPSLLVQIEEYASGRASDPLLRLALKPAEELTPEEKRSMLGYFFQANEEHLIRRYPRYAELFRIVQQCDRMPERAAFAFDSQMCRDLQVLSQLAWFDEEYLEHDPLIKALAGKGRNYDRRDQVVMGQKQIQAVANVLSAYQSFAGRRQIELSTSPFYHPIVPLICDSNTATISHPYIPLPAQFSYPEDAEEQLRRARQCFESKFGKAPDGFWPSEGSVSDRTLDIAARLGFRWTASDDGVLAHTLKQVMTPSVTYRPYLWRQGDQQINVVFRDHRLSDLIGFVYCRMDANDAAEHFMRELHKNCAPILGQGRDALVGIILDGENAWESYFRNGRPFLRALYSRISSDPQISALTMTEALTGRQAEPLKHIYPGSWIDANFDIWIGAEEDNRAWEQLLAARKTYGEAARPSNSISEENRKLALEELLVAEGSDWCWWYGPEHSSANRAEFDQLYRDHLANVYRLLGRSVPAELEKPLLNPAEAELHERPIGLIQPAIDGQLTTPQEWADAGRYRIDHRSGAMHSQRPLIQELQYGTDGQNLFLRLDVTERENSVSPLSFRFRLRNPAGEQFHIYLSGPEPNLVMIDSGFPPGAVTAAIRDLCEIRVSMSALHIRRGESVFLQLTLFREGLPVASLPVNGELELQSSPMTAYAF